MADAILPHMDESPVRSALRNSLAVLLATTALGVVSAHAVDGTWSGPGAEWTDGANWSSNPTVPDGTATFTNNGAPIGRRRQWHRDNRRHQLHQHRASLHDQHQRRLCRQRRRREQCQRGYADVQCFSCIRLPECEFGERRRRTGHLQQRRRDEVSGHQHCRQLDDKQPLRTCISTRTVRPAPQRSSTTAVLDFFDSARRQRQHHQYHERRVDIRTASRPHGPQPSAI